MEKHVSVVVPIRNESRYIEDFLHSLEQQTYPKEKMEWILVDGMSEDRTVHILHAYDEKHPGLLRVLENPDRTVPYAMNTGIRAAKGRYIIRLDAHSRYAPDYIEKCVLHLERSGADNVGGVAETVSRTKTGRTIAKVLSSRFGVGDSEFRTTGRGGYVDTVPFGAFPRELFDRIGYYDERLTRNQDNELNFRIRKNGGKILLSPDIRFQYFGRDTVHSLLKMARQNGYWNVITMQLMPGSMGIRHFIPLLFVVSLLVLPVLGFVHPLFHWLLLAEGVAYMALNALFSARAAESAGEFFFLLALFPLFHINYGAGSLRGVWRVYITRDALSA
ncbi:MAG: glycosyltransferase family 2 protein [Bacillota bacterium]|jgi:glycosyltransferase involved in cell wall biosynthesis|nr:glycosyltransferase family 2 protein [Bacillota bacterium]